MGADDLKSSAERSGCADAIVGLAGKRASHVVARFWDGSQARDDVGVGQAVAQHLDECRRADCGETLLGVVVVLLQVGFDKRFHHELMVGGHVALADENLAQRGLLVGDPGRHGANQGIAVDEAIVQRQDAEEEVAVAVGVRHVFDTGGQDSDGPFGSRNSLRRRGNPG